MSTKFHDVEFNHTAHTAIWGWLASRPGATKKEAFEALNIVIPAGYNACHACMYAQRASMSAAASSDFVGGVRKARNTSTFQRGRNYCKPTCKMHRHA